MLHDHLVSVAEAQDHVVARTHERERSRREARAELQRIGITRRAVTIVGDGVDAIAQVEHVRVGRAVARQDVVAGATLDRPGTADRVDTTVAVQVVAARPVRDDVVALATFQHVVARITVQAIIAIAADDEVDAVATSQGVVARLALDQIVAALALDGVVAKAALDEIDAVPALDGVVAGSASERCRAHLV